MDEKGKDVNPFLTIKKAVCFFLEQNIIVKETWNDSGLDIYSVNLRIEDTRICSNGKGTSTEYALASAYGEMFERLQNLVYFRINTEFHYYNFNYNDIVSLPSTDKKIKEYIKNWMKNFSDVIDEEILNKMCEISNDKGITLLSEYHELDDNQNGKIILPLRLVDLYYGTNGMAAGNSELEALVQGISEIVERSTVKKLLNNRIRPRQICCSELLNKEQIDRYISIAKSNGYKVKIIDLRLNDIDIPCFGVIFINDENANYFVKVGAHPNSEIAIERCFTEMMQGKKISSLSGMTKISEKSINKEQTFFNAFMNGEATYALENLTPYENGAYFGNTSYNTNQDAFMALNNMMKFYNMKKYVMNTSSNIFKSFHIIIPGISEVLDPLNKSIIDFEVKKKELKEMLMKINKLKSEELSRVLELFKILKYDEFIRLNSIIPNFEFRDSTNSKLINIHIYDLIIGICLINKNYDILEKTLYRILPKIKRTEQNKVFEYLYDYVVYYNQGYQSTDIERLLSDYYSAKCINRAKSFFNVTSLDKIFHSCPSAEFEVYKRLVGVLK